ncbi:MAG TPA: hypothetical protein PLZ76_07785, partial [Bacillota bacterium]|nr:hypothetical protein [Bacillota bacterium]
LSCYAESGFLNEWIGFPLRLRGFYAGLETSGTGIQRIGFAFVSYAFDGVESWEMMPLEDQEIAQILLDRLDPQIDGMIFQPFDQWYLQPYHPLLETAEVSFTVLQGAPWVSYADSYLSFIRPDGDVEGILRMSVTYGTGVATRDIVFTLNGFFLGTLDDLFISDENLTEVGVPMTVLYAQWGYCYFEYLDRLYYYDGFIPDWLSQNQAVILFGKRTTVDGIPELTYEIRALGNATDEYTLIPLNVDLLTLYEGGINYPEHYLRLSGTLGYDPFLDLFTLSADGKMVYIRDTMEEGSDGEYRWVGDGGLLTRQDFRDLLGEPVYLQVLLSSVMIRNEFLLVDFRGYSSELGLMPLGIEEALQVVGNKIYAQWNGRTFMSGDGLGWELPAYDPIHSVDIYYSVAPGQD